jgi:protocatechuate 3,4-dioxygenase, beta subunit
MTTDPLRRLLLRAASVALPLTSVAAAPAATQAALKPTPQDTEGPYYPAQWANDVDFDLVTLNGKPYGKGAPLELVGTVRASDGRTLANAEVQIWQTDNTGKYRHPRDDGEGPAQRGFQGYGKTKTDANGRYRFLTIKPVMYAGRPPHIHLRAVLQGQRTLTTQIYFSGENKEGGAFSGLGGFSHERDALTVTPVKSGGGLAITFDIVLA